MSESVRGIILAGVHQWRNSVFERAAPRPLAPVANRPLIEYGLRWLSGGGVTRQSVCANSDTRVLRRRLGDGSAHRIQLDYYEDEMPRGPAGCVRDAAGENGCGTFVVVDATVIPTRVDLAALLREHEQSGAAMTVVAAPAGRAGAGRTRHLSPAGIYVFDRRALQHVPADGYQDIKEALIPRLYALGEHVATHVVEEVVPRVTGAESYLAASERVLRFLSAGAERPQGHRRIGEAIVHETARVDPGARLIGSVLVGPDSRIEAEATLVSPATVGTGCAIARGAMVCRSMIWDHATVGVQARLDRCIVTHTGAVPAGAQAADMVWRPRGRPRLGER